ncbi:hypothetical protein LPJ61_000926 [Coemansia biformis]|uniref:TPR-like protein n=1 Tax=Coemansia biformis TaxID=1286918 RepID=A0A9W7YH05_9FUNG|nr:hypothetical protein LPJ61_000926 [Coemansia biformis]
MRNQSAALREIDAARCVGRWSAVGPLAARLTRHESPGQVFSLIVASEAELEEHLAAVEWDPQEHWKDEGARHDAQDGARLTVRYPMVISGSGRLGAIEKQLRQAGRQTMTEEEEYQYKVVLAKVRFHAADFAQCKGAIESLPVTIGGESSLSPAYAKQLYMAQMVMRGIALEMDGDLAAAHAVYETAVREFRSKLSPQAAVVVPRGSEAGSGPGNHEELVNWPEEALYRRAMLSLALGDKATGLRQLESYICHMDGAIPATFRAFRRLRANRLYMEIVRQGLAADPAAGVPRELRSSVMASHRRHMALLKALYAFPKANEAHAEVLDAVDCAAQDWELVGAFSRPDSLRLLEIMYEAAHLTHNSPRVLRHLVHALIRFGDYHEASLALGTYRMLVERQLEGAKKAVSAAAREGTGARGALDTNNVESINSILRTAVVGARLFFVHLASAPECLSLVHFANGLIEDVDARDPKHEVMPEVPHAVKAQLALWKGAAHGLLAQRSRDPDNRADHHTAALQLLQQAAAQCPDLYDAHYYLALEQALGARDIAAATEAAKQAVALDPRRLEAWHLLALLSTARKDFAKAQQICDVAMRQSEWWDVYCEIEQGAQEADVAEQPTGGLGLGLGLGVPGAGDAAATTTTPATAGGRGTATAATPGSTESGMDFFDIAMTRLAIEGRLNGYNACLEAQPRLFALYGRVYGPAIGSADDIDTASSAMEGGGGCIDALAIGSLRAGRAGPVARRRLSSSQISGKRSLARSLARSVLPRHARYSSHGGDQLFAPSATDDALPQEARPASPGPRLERDSTGGGGPLDASDDGHKQAESPKRQRSMPHLRQPSASSSAATPETPAEAYFDGLVQIAGRAGSGSGAGAGAGGRAAAVAGMHGSKGVYYTAVLTRLGRQRAEAKRALCALWLSTAAAFAALQRPGEAAGATSEALAACPESPEALTMRGRLAVAQSKHMSALNEFHAAVSLEANNIRASVGLAHVEYLLGRRDVALGLLKNITRAHGWSDPEAWYWLGRLERELALQQAGPDGAADARGEAARAQTLARALEYMEYALDLECSQPVRPFSILRP